jgi:hypothetical protein
VLPIPLHAAHEVSTKVRTCYRDRVELIRLGRNNVTMMNRRGDILFSSPKP